MKRTDLAIEFGEKFTIDDENEICKVSKIVIDKRMSEQTGKAEGTYLTVETDSIKKGERIYYDRVAQTIASVIEKLIKKIKKVKPRNSCCLIVGLGNPDMTADALGKGVSEKIMVTRHFNYGKDMAEISSICPNVLGVTGIESYDIVKGVVSRINPDFIIVIDSLAGATTHRIASAFQVSNAGITPGSGVSNHRARLDESSLSCPVISVGVPLVVYASTIINDALQGENPKNDEMDNEILSLVVTPKDVDLLVKDCSEIIAKAINITFFGDSFADIM